MNRNQIRKRRVQLLGLMFGVLIAAGTPPAWAQVEFLGPNSAAFQYDFGDLTRQTLANGGARLFGPTDSGGAGLGLGSLDLSAYASDGRFQVDLTPNAGNTSAGFILQLIDISTNSAGDEIRNGGSWRLSTGGVSPGNSVTVTSASTLSNPTSQIGDFSLFDPTSVDLFQVIGTFTNPSPFDINFNSVNLDNNFPPPPPYAGFEADAPWRAEAAARIEANRQADLKIRVVDALGNALPGAAVAVDQQEHAFRFGAAVVADRLGDNPGADPVYQENIKRYYNTATIENNLKWRALEGDFGPRFNAQTAAEAVAWLDAEGFTLRAHNIIWPGARHLPNALASEFLDGTPLSAGQQQQLRNIISQRITDVSNLVNGRAVAWDVVNEPRANRDFQDVLDEGDDALIDWFTQARAANPNAELVLNDFGILSSGGAVNTSNQQLLRSQVQALQNAGAPIDGVGLQGHFGEGNLTGPEQVWAILDIYDELGVNIEITEFDFNTANEQLQADFLRDFLTAAFAHEGVDRFVQWAPVETQPGGNQFQGNRPVFRFDWTPKPAGQAFIDLVFGEWWTDEDLDADAEGEATVRAFKGEQQVTGTFGDQSTATLASLAEDGDEAVVTLDLIHGDYNGDQIVSTGDFVVWRDLIGSQVAAAGFGADGDGDRTIGLGDLGVFTARFGNALPADAAAVAVPEPSTVVLLAALAGTTLPARRRRPTIDRCPPWSPRRSPGSRC